jgi:hypothetical protein
LNGNDQKREDVEQRIVKERRFIAGIGIGKINKDEDKNPEEKRIQGNIFIPAHILYV